MTEPEELLTVREVARRLRVDDTTVRRWIKHGTLEAVSLPMWASAKPIVCAVAPLRIFSINLLYQHKKGSRETERPVLCFPQFPLFQLPFPLSTVVQVATRAACYRHDNNTF